MQLASGRDRTLNGLLLRVLGLGFIGLGSMKGSGFRGFRGYRVGEVYLGGLGFGVGEFGV